MSETQEEWDRNHPFGTDKNDPRFQEIVAKANRHEELTPEEIAYSLPFIPELRKSMRETEHARAEGRTIPLSKLIEELEEMDKENE